MQSTETVLSSKCVCVLNHRWIPVGAIAGDGCCINVSREGLVADSVVLGRKFFVRVGLNFCVGRKGKKRAEARFCGVRKSWLCWLFGLCGLDGSGKLIAAFPDTLQI